VAEIRLNELAKVDGDVADLEALKKADIVREEIRDAKVILSGELSRAVTVKGLKVTKGAREAIIAAGGKVED
jgi:large subunit ribosomal protein L15